MDDKNKKTLTVIIPTWNRARYLEKNLEILDSYLKRGLDFKILVCNNGSTDGTSGVLKKYENHPQVKIINHPENIKYDRNVASGYLNFNTDYCFCLGDTKSLSYESLERIIKTINEEDLDAIVIKVLDKMPQSPKYYSDINDLMSELGWSLTNISSGVLKKELINLERCERYYDSLFIHFGVLVDALCFKEGGMRVKYDPYIEKKVIHFSDEVHPHGWSSNVCTIWGKVWPAFVLSLPWKISLEKKIKVIRDVHKYDHVLSLKKFIVAKINNDKSFFDDYKENKRGVSMVSTTPGFIYDLIAFIPGFLFVWFKPAFHSLRLRKQRIQLEKQNDIISL